MVSNANRNVTVLGYTSDENVNIEEMDKIQKDILNILKRLESHDDQM